MAVLSEVLRKRQNAERLFTGKEDLDRAFAQAHSSLLKAGGRVDGSLPGIPPNSFTELSGPAGSGKTAVWLSLVLETLKRGLNVLYVGCDGVPFPFSRAAHLEGWSADRFESRVEDIYVSSIEQLLLLESFCDLANYGLVVVSHYDALVKASLSRINRERAMSILMQKLSLFSDASAVVATAGSVKYSNEESVLLLAPASFEAKNLPDVVRLMLYKDLKGNCVISTGEKFRVASSGIVDSTDPTGDAVPLHLLSTKRRATPTFRHLSQPLTPQGSQRKRRLSVSTPSRHSRGSASQLSPDLTPTHTAPRPRSQPISSLHSSQPVPFRQIMSSPLNSESGTRPNVALTHSAQSCPAPPSSRQGSAARRVESAESNTEFLGVHVVQNSQLEANDSDFALRPRGL